jgi:hypothetical protein
MMRMSLTPTIIWKGSRVEKITHQDAGRVAEHRVGRLPTAPQVGSIDHVVVQQGRRVDELDHRREFVMICYRDNPARRPRAAPAPDAVACRRPERCTPRPAGPARHRNANAGGSPRQPPSYRTDQVVELLHSHNTAPWHKNLRILGAGLSCVKQGILAEHRKPFDEARKRTYHPRSFASYCLAIWSPTCTRS